jgi:hypothetical protein
MVDFLTFLAETHRGLVPKSVLDSYERAFRQELERLIQRTEDPKLREKFVEMLDCPVMTKTGCVAFSTYILAALRRANIADRYDIESALAYVMERMLMGPSLFKGFQERDYVSGNPLQARFMKYLQFAVRNIRSGKIPRLANVASLPSREGGRLKRVPAEESIPARRSVESDLAELIADISDILRTRERSLGVPLVAQFKAMLSGSKATEVRREFGDRKSRRAKAVILQVVRDYAEKSDNYALLNLLGRREQGASPRRMERQPANGSST